MKQLFYKALVILLLLNINFRILAQPTVLGSSIVNGSYTFYNLTDLGNFRQARVQALSSASISSRNWEFCKGTAASPDFSINWRPNIGGQIISSYNVPINPSVSGSSARYHTSFGGSSGLLNSINSSYYYTFNISELSSADNYMSLLETAYNPVGISSVTQCPSTNISNLSSVAVTINTSSAPSASEYFILRYTTNNWTTSTLIDFTMSGNVGVATIPAQTTGTSVSYYIYSSDVNSSSINSMVLSEGEIANSMLTLKLNDNSGANYNYSVSSATPMAGVYTINNSLPTSGTNFNNFTDAFCAINTRGSAAPGVTFDIAAGYTETNANLVLTAEGTALAPIVFEKAGSGVNPTITAAAGSGSLDGIIKLAGADYITFDGISLQESGTNSNATTRMEFGFALLKKNSSAPFNGCNNNTIKNCVVTLNKVNQNTYGVYIANHTTSNISVLNITAASDANSNNQIYSNTFQNLNFGIYASGYSASTSLFDLNNVIGGNNASLGNTIQNFGGSVASQFCGVYLIYQNNSVISNNTIDNMAGGGTAATSAIYGIFHNTADHSNTTITYNTVNIKRGTGISDFAAIRTAINGNGNVTIDYNTINLQALSGCSGVFYAIQQEGSVNTISINYNNFNNINSLLTSGGGFVIYNCNISTTNNISHNYITTTFNKSVSSAATVRYYYDNVASSIGTTNFHDNNLSNLIGGGATPVIGIEMISNVTETINIYNNTCSSFTGGNTSGGFVQMINISNDGTTNIYNNDFSNVTAYGNIDGVIVTGALGSVANIYGNKFGTFTASGTIPNVTALNIGSAGGLGTANIYNNKIYDLSAPALINTGAVTGINCGTQSAQYESTIYAYNNFIGDLRAPVGAVDNIVRGFYLNAAVSVVDYNTVYLNASSTGSSFGTSCIYSNWTNTLVMNNNLFINLSSAGSTGGRSVVFRFGNTTYSFWDNASNNNVFYLTAGTRRSIFYDGTNAPTTMSAYQTLVTPHDQQSISVLPVLLSTVGTSASFLHLDPAANCFFRGKGAPVTYTTDFDGDTRDPLYPTQGADEFISTDPGMWTGMISNSWHNNYNWCGFTVPTSSVNVTVPSAALNQPVITLTANCNSLAVQAAATLTMNSGTCNVYGNVTRTGTYSQTGGTLKFVGTQNQTVTGGISATIAEINNPGGISLSGGDLSISNSLMFTNGIITPGSGLKVNVTSTTASAITSGIGNTNYTLSFVNGTLQRSFAANTGLYDFPVGNATQGNLLQLQNNNAAGITSFQVSFGSKPGNDVGLSVSEGGNPYLAVNCMGVWSVVPSGSISSGNTDVKLFISNASGLSDNNFAMLTRPLASSNAVDWQVPAGSNLPSINTAGRTLSSGYARRNSVTTFNQIGIGQTSTSLIVQQPASISTCDLSTITFTISGAVNLNYQWQQNSGGGFSNISNGGIYSGANTNALTLNGVTLSMSGYQYRCVLSTTDACPFSSNSNAATLTVNSNTTPTVTITPSSSSVCAGASATFTASNTGGGATPIYNFKWNGVSMQNSTQNTFTASGFTNGDVVTCTMATSGACLIYVNSNSVTMSVNPNLVPAVSIGVSQNNVCAGTSVTVTATPTNGGPNPVYNFKKNNISIQNSSSNTYTGTFNNNDVITCVMTANNTCQTTATANSNSVTMIVNPNLVPQITVTESANNICQGSSVTFTTSIVNGGATPQYNFKINNVSAQNGSANQFTTTALNNNDVVKCVLQSNNTCQTTSNTTSNSVTMTVNSNLVPLVSIATSQNNFCSGSSVTITATPTNGGPSPLYNFKVNGTSVQSSTSNQYTTTLFNNNDAVTCLMTANNTCQTTATANSNALTMNVVSNLVPSVSLSAQQNNVCPGTSITVSATPTNGGSSPLYNFKVNGISVQSGSSSSYTSSGYNNNDVVTCVMTSNNTCQTTATSTSNGVTIIIQPNLVPSVSIQPSDNDVCDGNSVTITANPVNGGSSPQFNFYVNGISVQNGTLSSYTAVFNDGDVVTCVMTSNNQCQTTSLANSNTISITVLPYGRPDVSIVSAPWPACVNGTVVFTATPVFGGNNPYYDWYLNGNIVGNNTDQLILNGYIDGDVIYTVLTSDYKCRTTLQAVSEEDTIVTTTPVTFYYDNDADGYGDPGNQIVDCYAPSGYVSDNTDCNDGDGDIHPHAPPTSVSLQPLTSSCLVSWNPGCCTFRFQTRRKAVTSSTWSYAQTAAASRNLAGLVISTQYEVQVRSIYGVGDTSVWTPSYYFTTLAACPVPINLSTSNITSTKAKMKYSSAVASATFSLRYRSIDSTTWITVSRGATTTFYNAINLVPNKVYYWQIRHKCGADNSPWSALQTFTTLAGPRLNGYTEDTRELSVFPNPNNGTFVLSTSFSETQQIEITVTDMFGKKLLDEFENVSAGDFDKDINTTQLPAGNYLLQVISNEGLLTQTFIKQE